MGAMAGAEKQISATRHGVFLMRRLGVTEFKAGAYTRSR